jgi:hypothetical protein
LDRADQQNPPRKARRILYDEGWVLLVGLIAFGAAGLGLFWMVLPRGPGGFLRLAAMAGALLLCGGLVGPLVTRVIRKK